jgi:mevalonate kinase
MCGWQSNRANMSEHPKTQQDSQQQTKNDSINKQQQTKPSQLDIYLSCHNAWLAIKSFKSVGKTSKPREHHNTPNIFENAKTKQQHSQLDIYRR